LLFYLLIIVKNTSNKNPQTCKLCLEKKQLCNSHIIPEFIYKPIYDKQQKFYAFQLEGLPYAENKGYRTKHRKGIREYLLCNDCEKLLSGYESYVKQNLFENLNLSFPLGKRVKYTKVDNINYQKLKFFQLSILWRASISSDELFKNVKLGIYEDKLRKVLLKEEDISPERYPCMMFALIFQGTHNKEIILDVDKIRLEHSSGYVFIFGGFVWLYCVSENPKSCFKNYSLNSKDILISKINAEEINRFNWFVDSFRAKGGFKKEWK
jgi:hypothetical protein